MKNKHFYSHLIETTDITIELGEMDLTPDQRVQLIALVEANIHSSVMNTVLSQLSEEDKKVFLKNLVSDNHEEIWRHLRKKIKNADKKIKKSIEDLKKELYKDIKDLKKN